MRTSETMSAIDWGSTTCSSRASQQEQAPLSRSEMCPLDLMARASFVFEAAPSSTKGVPAASCAALPEASTGAPKASSAALPGVQASGDLPPPSPSCSGQNTDGMHVQGQRELGGPRLPLHLHMLAISVLATAEAEGVVRSPKAGMPVVQLDSKRRKITICRLSKEEVEMAEARAANRHKEMDTPEARASNSHSDLANAA